MVHVPAKFWENQSMRFWVTVRKLLNDRAKQTKRDRRTDEDGQTGGIAISPVQGRSYNEAGGGSRLPLLWKIFCYVFKSLVCLQYIH